MKVVLLKLGGSLITDKTKKFTANLSVIKNLCRQIKEALDYDNNLRLVIGNGGGSFPHYPALKYQMSQGIKTAKQLRGFCEVADAAARLNRMIVAELLAAGVNAFSLNPSSMIVARNGSIKDFFIEPVVSLINLNITPVIYGDIVCDEKMGSAIFSTEKLLTEIAFQLKNRGFNVTKAIHNGITEGVLDSDGKIIEKINKNNFVKIKNSLKGASGYDVTGGMLHKVEESLKLAKEGIKSVIINGSTHRSLLKNALLGKRIKGTSIGY